MGGEDTADDLFGTLAGVDFVAFEPVQVFARAPDAARPGVGHVYETRFQFSSKRDQSRTCRLIISRPEQIAQAFGPLRSPTPGRPGRILVPSSLRARKRTSLNRLKSLRAIARNSSSVIVSPVALRMNWKL